MVVSSTFSADNRRPVFLLVAQNQRHRLTAAGPNNLVSGAHSSMAMHVALALTSSTALMKC